MENQTTELVWIMGCGDIGRRVAGLYQSMGQNTSFKLQGWARSTATIKQGLAVGITMQQGDADQGEFPPLAQFDNACIYWLMPPPAHGESDTRLRAFLAQVQAAPQRIVLISTTGVYGDCHGAWVDETSPVKPQAARAKRRVDAELAVQAWAQTYQREAVILRVPGIYALDRLPLERIKRGEPILHAAEAPWTNRIHADDLAMICLTAMQKAPAGALYNATDGQPSTMTEYFNAVADFAGLPRPPQVSMTEAQTSMSAGMLSYLQESRRIRNDKLLTALGIRLQYPSLNAALAGASSDHE